MLTELSIQNIVLIDHLHINFGTNFYVLTGETGAGKSILLDALGLALGARADTRLLRQGAEKASVTALFSPPRSHSLWQDLEEQGILCDGDEVIFRRLLDSEGKSKCFVNDQMVSQTFMKKLGQDLVEIHGQFDQLLEPKSHLTALDSYGRIEKAALYSAFQAYREAKENLKSFQERLAKSVERQAFLSFAIEEFEKVAPKEGEEKELENERSLVAHKAKIAETLFSVDRNLEEALSSLADSYKALCKIEDLLPDKMNPLLEGVDRALIECQDAWEGTRAIKDDIGGTQQNLEALDNRLYALRTLSRKYQTNDLVACLAVFKEEAANLELGDVHLKELEGAIVKARARYFEEAQLVSEARKKASLSLQEAISQELPPLKLEHAQFRVHMKDISEDAWGPSGIDHLEFYIQTNPGTPEGPLAAVASGGELSRLMLALKVVLAQSEARPTLIFDEIESGTGGAVASAMGERLKALSQNIQILAITHSPQIAAYGTQHLTVFKVLETDKTTTHVKALSQAERFEEVARMLAGEEITEEARAAAKRLIGRE